VKLASLEGPVARGFGGLPCPYCGEDEATMTVSLADGGLSCCECEVEFTAADLRAIFARWAPVLQWLDLLPQLPE
jgi:hypothetical protein